MSAETLTEAERGYLETLFWLFEAGLPLTPVNAQRFSRLHPRCGTSFLLVVMIVAIFVFAPIGLPAWY